MTDTELRDLLHEGREHEPAFLLDPGATIRQGRRRRHLRNAAVGVAAAAVVGVAGVGVGSLATGGAPDQGAAREVEVAAGEKAATPAPALQPDQPLGDHLMSLTTDTFGATVPDLGAGALTVLAPPGQPVDQADPTAQHFRVLQRSPDRVMISGVIARPAAPSVVSRCDGASLYDSCTDTVRSDGSHLSVAVGPVSEPGADGGFRMYTGRQATRDADELFYRRSVTLITPEGTEVYADEFVRADSVASAEAAWAVPVEALSSLVVDPTLTAYALPHAAWH